MCLLTLSFLYLLFITISGCKEEAKTTQRYDFTVTSWRADREIQGGE